MSRSLRVQHALLVAALAATLAVPARATTDDETAQGPRKAMAYAGCAVCIITANSWSSGWLAVSTCFRLYLDETD